MAPEELLIAHLTKTEYADLPQQAVERARLAILDTVGVALAGTARGEIRPIVDLVLESGGRPESSVIGAGTGVPAPQAALANGTLARAWDFDDVFKLSPGGGHASVNVLPAALAVAERVGAVSGRQFLAAVVLAEDLFCRLSLAVKTDAPATGRYCMFSVFAPAAAAGKLLGLDEEAMGHALGIAYAQAAGEMQKYRSSALTIVVQNGFTPMAGVLAALLAQRGVTGAREVFTGPYGFFRVFEPDHDLEALTRDLGRHYAGVEVSPKAYPCCSCTHTAIEAALHLARIHDLHPEEIGSVRIGVNRPAYELTGEPRALRWDPRATSSRQFSLPYAVAAALVDREISVDSFRPDPERDARIWELLKATEAEVDPAIQAAFGHLPEGPGRVMVRTRSGAEYSHLVEYERGHIKNPMTWADIVAKFEGCWRSGRLPRDGRAGEIVEIVGRLEGIEDLRPLGRLLRDARV